MAEKKRDRHGAWRSLTVSFSASREESDAINEAVRLSGLTKQDYILSKLLNRDVVVAKSPRTYKLLKDKMDEIIQELKRIETASECTESFLETIKYVTTIYTEMKEN